MKTFEEFRFKVKHSSIVNNVKPLLSLEVGDYFYLIIKNDRIFRRCTLYKEIKLGDYNLYEFKYKEKAHDKILGAYVHKDDISKEDTTVCLEENSTWFTSDFQKAIELCESVGLDVNKMQEW